MEMKEELERPNAGPPSLGPSIDFVVLDGLCSRESHENLENGIRTTIEMGFPGSRVWMLDWGEIWENPAWFFEIPPFAVVDVARNLLLSLASIRKADEERDKPIIFIGASIGGIVAKQVVLLCQITKEFQSVMDCIQGVIFLGTPHGEDSSRSYAQILASFGELCKRYEAADALAVNSDYFRHLTHSWGQLRNLPTYSIMPPEIGKLARPPTEKHRPIISAATTGTEYEIRVPLRTNTLDPDELDDEYLKAIFRCVQQIVRRLSPDNAAIPREGSQFSEAHYSLQTLPPKWCPICLSLPPGHLPVGPNVPPQEYMVSLDPVARNGLRIWARYCALANFAYRYTFGWPKQLDIDFERRKNGWVSDYSFDKETAQWPCYSQNQKAELSGGSWSVRGAHIYYKPQRRRNGEFSLGKEHDVPFWWTTRFVVVHRNPLSQPTQRQINSWIKQCDEGRDDHHYACHSTDTMWLPSRLLDIQNLEKITLFDSEEIRSQDGDRRYAALSHCWGSSRDFLTTRASLAGMKRGFPLCSRMPKTFSDAITVAHTLGIPYLWIDSLCIIQDDASDWVIQASEMASVYSNSTLTIAAAASDGDDKGFLHPRSFPYFTVKLNLPNSPPVAAYLSRIEDVPGDLDAISESEEPLFTRAWVLQEQQLSRRILVFSKAQIYFVCRENDFPEVEKGNGNNLNQSKGFYRSTDLNWQRVTKLLSARKLTYDTDKLPCIAGIASEFNRSRKGGNTQYCTGLWRDELPDSLLFTWVGVVAIPSQYIAPSWSWISQHGQVEQLGYHPYTQHGPDTVQSLDTTRVVDCTILLQDPRSPYGQVMPGCSLTIHTNLIEFLPFPGGSQQSNCSQSRRRLPLFPAENQTPYGLHVAGKGPRYSRRSWFRRTAIWCGYDSPGFTHPNVMGLALCGSRLQVFHSDTGSPEPTSMWKGLLGLLVVPVGGGEGVSASGYRRVGIFEIFTPMPKVTKQILKRFPPKEVVLY
ncbi:heterokaryon incompatibility protein-domain-containing protein [Lasiosphaeria hispida]|uniref:Heterokaryon incompatibility protein-domain-containing protein n=1 Tax=Lasiosphaeria hispida TaxID=260671 RepID=A0AAJ0MKV7_9PEZI|nr:heterokaryon incompatibility protein-domain-containing protein [Lasiosphaeria hispida]